MSEMQPLGHTNYDIHQFLFSDFLLDLQIFIFQIRIVT